MKELIYKASTLLWLIPLLVAMLVIQNAWAAQLPVTFISATRSTTNDDGSPYTNPKAFRWNCGTVAAGAKPIETETPDANMGPPPTGDQAALGVTLDVILTGQPDGDYFCVVRDVTTDDFTSGPSNESERIIKVGTNFFAVRPVPNAPATAPLLN